MNLRQLILSQPKLMAGGAAGALVVGLGFGWLARAPMDRAMAHTSAHTPAPAAAQGVTVVDTPVPPAARAPITATLYPNAFDRASRRARQYSAPASSDEQRAAYDETQPRGDVTGDRGQDRPPDPPPPPSIYGFGPD